MSVQAYYNRSCSENSFASDPFPETDKCYLDEQKDFRLKHPKNLISGHLNINSLRNKFIETTEILTPNYLDTSFFSETKIDHSYPSAQFHIPDFICHRVDRNEHGGGLICYIRNDLTHRRRADRECLVPVPAESLIIEVIVRQENGFSLVCTIRVIVTRKSVASVSKMYLMPVEMRKWQRFSS